MQLVTAIIQPFMVDRLTRALRKANDAFFRDWMEA